jgi:transposase InsO family protein
MESIKEQGAFTAFERLFQERGLPQAIRSDNGVPFASPNGLFNLSRLAVWWLRLGITIERIQPAHPQQNGRHERMHRTLKIQEFNHECPHETLQMNCPAEIYKPSTRQEWDSSLVARFELCSRTLPGLVLAIGFEEA